ncbi:hypothetical protein H5410_016229 [Solanum commersonii]|uniref:Uncharacterized protein n=1 Tax=Solanum commersonii TaxID=4109 RepID=A0A9J5ZVN5_SOLCO|nr:hypothetical protein H5410_016229 [Solanum commersonii]
MIQISEYKQRATILEVRDNQGWNLSFRRMLNDWEVERLTDFYNTLEQFKDYSTRVDSLVWLKDKQGRFFVKSAYKCKYATAMQVINLVPGLGR